MGLHPLPLRHGLTCGELARWLQRERGIGCDLEVIRLSGWGRHMSWADTGLPWVMPSPNLPTPDSYLVYPGMVLLEGTNLSEGCGTTRPFELFGAPGGCRGRRERRRDTGGCGGRAGRVRRVCEGVLAVLTVLRPPITAPSPPCEIHHQRQVIGVLGVRAPEPQLAQSVRSHVRRVEDERPLRSQHGAPVQDVVQATG